MFNEIYIVSRETGLEMNKQNEVILKMEHHTYLGKTIAMMKKNHKLKINKRIRLSLAAFEKMKDTFVMDAWTIPL